MGLKDGDKGMTKKKSLEVKHKKKLEMGPTDTSATRN